MLLVQVPNGGDVLFLSDWWHSLETPWPSGSTGTALLLSEWLCGVDPRLDATCLHCTSDEDGCLGPALVVWDAALDAVGVVV